MARGFIDPESDLATTARRVAAAEWGKRAVDLAKAAGQSVDAASLDHWLAEAEPQEARDLRTANPVLYQERHDEAAIAVQEFATIEGVWSA
jgi:hypothetical protein